MADIKERILLQIQLNQPEIEKQLNSIREATAKTKDQQTALRKEYNDYLKTGDSASAAKISTELNKVDASLKSLGAEQRNYSKQLQLSQEIAKDTLNGEALSRQQLVKLRDLESSQLNKLKGTLKQNADGTIVLSEQYVKSSETLKGYNETLIQFDQGIKDGRSNVGNYASSIKDAFTETGLFDGALSNVRDTFNGVQNAQQLFTQGLSLTKNGFKDIGGLAASAKEKVASFFKSKPDTGALDAVGDLATDLPKVEKGAVAGARGMNVLKVAIASTGIGLLVIALAGIVAAFSKTEKGAEFLERKFAAIGGVVDFLTGAVVKLGEFMVDAFTKPQEAVEKIAKFLANPVAAITNFTKGMQEAATAAENLKQQEQDLEDAQRDALNTQEQYRQQSARLRLIEQDRTKSAKERVQASEEAAKIEQQALLEQLKLQKLELANQQASIALKLKNGTVRDEDYDKLVEQTVKLQQLAFETENKVTENKSNSSKLRNQITKDEITNSIALLDNQLKTLVLNGQSSIDLERQIAKRKRDEALADSTISATEKQKIESDFQLRLLEIDKKYSEEKRKITQQTEDIAVSIITDGATKEIATEMLSLQRKLETIKGNSEEENKLRESLKQQSVIKITEITNKYEAVETAELVKNLDKKVTAEIAANQKAFIDKENNLKIQLSKNLISEQQYNQQILQAKVQSAENELTIETNKYNQRVAIQASAFTDEVVRLSEQLEKNNITKEQYDNLYAEALRVHNKTIETITDEGNTVIIEKTNAVNQTKVDSTVSANNQIVESSKKSAQQQAEITQLQLEFAGTLVSGFKTILAEDQKNRKEYAGIVKALGIGEVTINLQRELSGIAAGTGKDISKLGLIAGAFVTPLAALQSSIAIARAGFAIQKITATKFEHGGFSYDGEPVLIDDIIRQYNPVVNNSLVNTGGYVSQPTLSTKTILTGEAGVEHISPSWMVNNPKLKPVYNILETIRRNKVIPFADGGYTSPIPFLDGGLSATFNSQRVDVESLADAIIKGNRSLPTPVVAVQDINDAQSNLLTVQGRADL